jgi:hypothetical protein
MAKAVTLFAAAQIAALRLCTRNLCHSAQKV